MSLMVERKERKETRHTAKAISTTVYHVASQSISVSADEGKGTHAARERKAAAISSSVGDKCAMDEDCQLVEVVK